MAKLSRVARPQNVLIVTWALELCRIAWPDAVAYPVGTVLMALYVALALPRLRRQTAVLCAVLAFTAFVVAVVSDAWHVIGPALERTTVFTAFFGTIMILRATADRHPEMENTRSRFEGLSAGQRTAAFLAAAHFIGGILVVGVMAVLAPILRPDASEQERRAAAEVCLRGMCLAPLWSPFWIAMAVAYQHLPMVPLWQIMAIGLPLALCGLILAHWMYARRIAARDLFRAMLGLRPILPPVAVAAAAITIVTSVTPLTTLQSVAVCTPVLCGAVLITLGWRGISSAARTVYDGVGRVADEITLVTVAVVLGRILEHGLSESGIAAEIAGLSLPPIALIALTVFVIASTAIVGIHQLVTMTLMLVLFAPLSVGLNDVVLMESALVGWAFASMVGISAVSVAVAGSMFRQPIERLVFGPNQKFVLAFGLLAILYLAAVNRLF